MTGKHRKGSDMKVSATLKYARISPQKCRLIMHAIRGNEVLQALRTNLLDAPIVDKIISNILFACSSEKDSFSST